MRSYQYVGEILDTLRRSPKQEQTLSILLKTVINAEFVPDHTGGGILGGTIGALARIGMIKLILPSDQDFNKRFVNSYNGNSIDYHSARNLSQAGENNLIVVLTENTSLIQALFGVSITELKRSINQNEIRTIPFFSKPDDASELKCDVFVLMPFLNQLQPVYEDHIRSACEQANKTCRRADDFFRVGQIMHDVWSAIYLSDWVIADCTGRNPNVFYEMGIAHTLGKPVILITQNQDDVPSDIKHLRYIRYDFTPRGMKALEEALTTTLLNKG